MYGLRVLSDDTFYSLYFLFFFFFQAEDGIRDYKVTGVQTCALPISSSWRHGFPGRTLHEIVDAISAAARYDLVQRPSRVKPWRQLLDAWRARAVIRAARASVVVLLFLAGGDRESVV